MATHVSFPHNQNSLKNSKLKNGRMCLVTKPLQCSNKHVNETVAVAALFRILEQKGLPRGTVDR